MANTLEQRLVKQIEYISKNFTGKGNEINLKILIDCLNEIKRNKKIIKAQNIVIDGHSKVITEFCTKLSE